MKPLHQNQERLLAVLKAEHQEPLTLKDLQEATGLASHNLVLHHIRQLEKRGLLRRNPSNPNDYQVLDENPETQVNYINLYGMAECGPNGGILDGNPIDRIPISSRMFGFSAKDAFMVKARGKSMEPIINHGDLVVAQLNKVPKDGDIIVCTYKEGAMIKRFTKEGTRIILESENRDFKRIPIEEPDAFTFVGIVKGVYSSI